MLMVHNSYYQYQSHLSLSIPGELRRRPYPPPFVVIDSLTHPQLTQPTIDLTPLSLPIRYIVEKIIGGVIDSSRDNAGRVFKKTASKVSLLRGVRKSGVTDLSGVRL